MTEKPETSTVQEPIISYDKKWTYADYLNFDFEYMVELIKGQIFKMSPAPTSWHQMISTALIVTIGGYLKSKSCQLFHSPFDVILPIANEKKNTSTTVVQPDLCIICDLEKIEKVGCFGPPDLIIEILSPSTKKKDLTHKYEIFEETGVPEYWVIYPNDKMLQIHLLEEGSYNRPLIFDDKDVVSPYLFPDLKIDLKLVFVE